MWERWKGKIKNMFSDEQTTEEEKNREWQQNPQAKVKYQYPKKTPFRFPVIPDQTNQINMKDSQSSTNSVERNMEKPAFIRKENKREKAIQNEAKKHEVPKESKIKRTSNKQFKPSQVASPIYGFQKRRETKEVEDVPAYLRNEPEKDKLKQKQQVNNEENKEQSEELTYPVEMLPYKEEKIHNEKPEQQISLEKNESIKQENITPKEERSYIQEQPKKRKQTRAEIRRQERAEKQKRKMQKKEESITKKEPVLPFSVLMNPVDRRNVAKNKTEGNTTISNQQTEVDEKKRYTLPHYLLEDPIESTNEDNLWVLKQQELLEETLKHFKVRAKVVNATQGPSVTRFEVQPELGVKVSKVRNLSDDIKMNMSAKDIRIEAPIPGKNTIGIEVPNLKAQKVGLQELLETEEFEAGESSLTIGLGLNVEGKSVITNISKMPHGLIAGATGSGKSVCINTILLSLLYKSHYEEVKFLLIDPKMVELAPYNGIPHLVSPVITDVKAATAALKWAVTEMEERYERFVEAGVRDIERYNEKKEKEGKDKEKMPFIVIVIDELADLMMAAPQDVEDAICRIAQKARACGMHLIIATQRPSVDVITGLIKANIPTRIAFSVSSQIDSRTIIDSTGAERLLGRGDMLFIENGSGKSTRLQGAFVSDKEIERVTSYTKSIAEPNYLFEQEQLIQHMETDVESDELLEDVIRFISEHEQASTSLLQRRFRIGYNRAARLIDTLEQQGIITGQNGSKPRELLLSKVQLEELYPFITN